MRALIIAAISLIVICAIYFSVLMPPLKDNVPEAEQGKWIYIRDFQYTKKDSVTIDFNVLNTSPDTLYVQVSEWYIFGVFSRFKRMVSSPLYPRKNTITFIAQLPRFKRANYDIDTESIFTKIRPEYNLYKHIILAPDKVQKIHLNLGYDLTKHMSLSLNDFKFTIQMFYYTKSEWNDLKKHSDAEIDRFLIQRSTSPVNIDIPHFGQNTLLKRTEFIYTDYDLPCNPGVPGEFMMK